jgi:hypothetical protein
MMHEITLTHKIGNDSMKSTSLEVKWAAAFTDAFFTSAESSKIFSSENNYKFHVQRMM